MKQLLLATRRAVTWAAAACCTVTIAGCGSVHLPSWPWGHKDSDAASGAATNAAPAPAAAVPAAPTAEAAMPAPMPSPVAGKVALHAPVASEPAAASAQPPAPVAAAPAPAPAPAPAAPPPAPLSRAQQALADGVRQFQVGLYAASTRSLQDAQAAGLKDPVAAATLHEYLAMNHCVAKRVAQCRAEFKAALKLFPGLALEQAYMDDPRIGPHFAAAKAAP